MLTRLSIFFMYVVLGTCINIHSAVMCDQLSSLAPGIMKFIAHPQGKLIAAQEATSGSNTHLAFYEFQKGNEGGKKPQLKFSSALEQENAQGIIWSWATTQQRICFGTPTGKFAVYEIPTDDDLDEAPAPVLLGEKQKDQTIKAISWGNEGDLFAIILDKKLVLYALNPESKKRPIRRAASLELPIDDISFLSWSHDDSMIAVGNSSRILFLKTKTQSGTLRPAPFTNFDLDQALKNISGPIKDIAWNKTGTPTIAILNKKLMLISFQVPGSTSPISVFTNFATNTSAKLAWNTYAKTCTADNQELIVAHESALSYQVYTLTSRSLMFDTAAQEFLPPYGQNPQPAPNRFQQKPAKKHFLSDETTIELVNKFTTT